MSGELEDVLAEMQAGPEQPYARCVEEGCGAEFADREAASKHLEETRRTVTNAELLAAGGVLALSHAYRVINPTPEERRRQHIDSEIDSLLEELYHELDQKVSRGDFTVEEVKERMRYFDLDEGWDEYMAGGD